MLQTKEKQLLLYYFILEGLLMAVVMTFILVN